MRPQVLQHNVPAFIFDLDGTLVDSTAGIANALCGAFASIGRTVQMDHLREAIGPPIGVIARRLQADLTDRETRAIEVAYRSLYDRDGWKLTTLFAGVERTLRTLHGSGHRLFLVTNKPLLPTSKILDHFGLSGLFVEVLARDAACPSAATKAAMLAGLILRHGLQPASSFMVGDTPEDQEAAEANGVQFIFVSYGYGEVKTAGRTVDRFCSLLREDGSSHEV